MTSMNRREFLKWMARLAAITPLLPSILVDIPTVEKGSGPAPEPEPTPDNFDPDEWYFRPTWYEPPPPDVVVCERCQTMMRYQCTHKGFSSSVVHTFQCSICGKFTTLSTTQAPHWSELHNYV